MASDPFETLASVAAVVPASEWMLVGGLMVHCHAQREQVSHARPTHDADLVVEIQASSYPKVAHAVQQLGFQLHEPLDARAPLHRFERVDGSVVDLMAPDRLARPQRYLGRLVIDVPGSSSAFKRTVTHSLPDGSLIRIPDLASALSLKSEAYFLPGAHRERHLQDAVTLLVCLDRQQYTVSRSMQRNMTRITNAVQDHPDAWQMCPPADWPKAIRAARTINPGWEPPEFIRPSRPGRGSR